MEENKKPAIGNPYLSPRAGYVCLFIFVLGFTVDQLNLVQ